MSTLARLIIASTFLFTSSFVSVAGNDDGFCNDVKKITSAFNNKEFDKLKGELIDDGSDEKSYVSTIEIKGYIAQFVSETEKQTYFAAVLNQDFTDAEALKTGLEKLLLEFESCLGIKMEYSETKSFMHYTYIFESGVELNVSASYPHENRRQLGFEVTYNKQ